ncbi:MAG TPA: carbamoyltransferase HypF [Chloroflexia bacterium]|nr:carbamoyltransferase HypF [Chloroflexia bacterium]
MSRTQVAGRAGQAELRRMRVTVRGAVQGVGFRPFVYRLALDMGLPGWVNNSPQGVFVEVEGRQAQLDEFVRRLEADRPPRSFIQSMEPVVLDPVGYTAFEIRPSVDDGSKSALILPDITTCAECIDETFDPSGRRYLYPFTNCTNCGPRFTIIESLPYDRPNTTMKGFPMCEDCRAEYEDPLDRRFHAQPIACPRCGPQLQLWTPGGDTLAHRHNALVGAVMALHEGCIVAVKGLGGFMLLANARREDTIARLRERKHREEKPFAMMYPAVSLVAEHCELSDAEHRLLRSPESPIVLLRRQWASCEIAPNVALNSPYFGVMLPYTPLHHLLMSELGFPVVATSGNLSDEPICIDEHDALERLAGVADLFLVHNRPIARHADDSVARVLAGREMIVRRARGYAPLPVRLDREAPPMLAVGAHLKNTAALAVGRDVFVSQHIGDLETAEATNAFVRVVSDLQRLYDARPQVVACDEHPDYLSTHYAESLGLPVRKVQHHAAHVYACMAENGLSGPVLGVSWDGTGYGLDGTVWGGEFLRVDGGRFTRSAHLRTFRLPGGDRAAREPRRSAVGLLYELFGSRLASREALPAAVECSEEELRVWLSMLEKGVNSPVTSSAGRLFDAVSSIAGVRQVSNHEGQAAMELEFAIDGAEVGDSYSFHVLPPGGISREAMVVDWGPAVLDMLSDLSAKTPVEVVSARFHNTLAEMIVAVAERVGERQVALTGGCFQNAYLLERAIERLRDEGFQPYWHQRIPPNDGGIALGQIVGAALQHEA